MPPVKIPELVLDHRARPVSGGQQPLSGITQPRRGRVVDLQPPPEQPIEATPRNPLPGSKQSL